MARAKHSSEGGLKIATASAVISGSLEEQVHQCLVNMIERNDPRIRAVISRKAEEGSDAAVRLLRQMDGEIPSAFIASEGADAITDNSVAATVVTMVNRLELPFVPTTVQISTGHVERFLKSEVSRHEEALCRIDIELRMARKSSRSDSESRPSGRGSDDVKHIMARRDQGRADVLAAQERVEAYHDILIAAFLGAAKVLEQP